MTRKATHLPISNRPAPDGPSWLGEEAYLLEVGANSRKTESGYRSALRLFADWLQYFRRVGYSTMDPWPLSPDNLTTKSVLDYRHWLMKNRANATVITYMAGLVGYLYYLDGRDRLPAEVQLAKLQQQLARRRVERNQAENVIDLDAERQAIPRIVEYYNDLPLPLTNDQYNRRLILLRDRAIVNILYSTAARISEIVALNRTAINNGHSSHAIVTGKGNKGRTLHLRRYAQTAVRAYLAERQDKNRALFVAHSRNSHNPRLSITAVHNIVKRAVRELGLHEGLSAHDFRHFRATQLLRQGVPLEVLQEMLGHADINTTRSIYAPFLGAAIVEQWLDKLEQPPELALEANRRGMPGEKPGTPLMDLSAWDTPS